MELKDKMDLFVERHYDNVNKMEKFNELIAELIESEKNHFPEKYRHFVEDMDILLNCIYYEQVEDVLHHIHRKDKIEGIKWTLEEIKSLKPKYFAECLEEPIILWYLMNKNYAIHFDPSMPLEFYVNLTKDVIRSKDEDIEDEIRYRHEKIKKK